MPEVVIRNNNVTVYVTQPSTLEAVKVIQGPAGPQGAPGVVQSVVPGANVTVDSTDPANPVVSAATPVADHGALTGLGDDDHTQYHNDARGDARYYTKAQVDTALATKAPAAVSRCRAQMAGAGSAPTLTTGTTTVLNLDAEAYDTDGMHSNTVNPSRVTFNKAGAWLVIGQVGFVSGVSATGRRMCMIRKDGATEVGRAVVFPTSTALASAMVTVVVQVTAAGEYVELQAYQDSGGNLGVQWDYPYLAVAYLGT